MKPDTKSKHCKRRIKVLLQTLKEAEKELDEICRIIDGERGVFSQTNWFIGSSTTHNASSSLDVAISALMRMRDAIENGQNEKS